MAPHPLPRELQTILDDVFPRANKPAVHNFGLDVLALAAGLRTACLLDTLIMTEQSGEKLGRALQSLGWEELFVLFERQSEQAWVVNRTLLDRRAAREDWPTWVEVGGASPARLHKPPDHLLSRLRALASRDAPRHLHLLTPPDCSLVQTLVPLTAFLLEYPIAYTLDADSSSNPTNCLGGRSLSVVRVWLRATGSEGHLLLSFSSPEELPLSVGRLAEHVRSRIDARLAVARRQVLPIEWDAVEVDVRRGVRLDRVAL